jgi:hypothetical protein
VLVGLVEDKDDDDDDDDDVDMGGKEGPAAVKAGEKREVDGGVGGE